MSMIWLMQYILIYCRTGPNLSILAPTLEIIEKVNEYIMSLIPSDGKVYLSCDSICKSNEDVGVDNR